MRLLFTVFTFAWAISTSQAADIPAIEFPDVDGWVKGKRYDATPGARVNTHTYIPYTTKAKVGADYVRIEVMVPKAEGKSLKDALPAFEKVALDNPVHKNTKKTGSKEITVSKTKVTQVTFASTFSGNLNERVMFVFPYDTYFIKIEHVGPAADSAKRAAETMKLVKAIVEAAEKK